VIADQGAGNLDALAFQNLGDFPPHEVLLHERGAAQAVKHRDDRGCGEVMVSQDGFDDLSGNLGGSAQHGRFAAGLTMDADAQLHLVLAEVESGLAGCRNCAGGEGYSKGATTVIDALSELEQGVDIALLLGRCAEDLLGQHRQADPATPSGVQGVLHGNIVGDNDGLDAGASLHRGHLGSHVEVHDVTGVVLDDVQYTGPTVNGFGGLGDLVRHGGGEDLTAACGVEHASPHVA